MTEPFDFLEVATEYNRRKTVFEDALMEKGLGDYCEFGWDQYDDSLELYRVNPERKCLTEQEQKVIYEHGFIKAYVNYSDGRAEVYDWGLNRKTPGFKAVNGLQVSNHNSKEVPFQ